MVQITKRKTGLLHSDIIRKQLCRFIAFLLLSGLILLSYLNRHTSKRLHSFRLRVPYHKKITREVGCSVYGCDIYPRELTDDIRKDISEIKGANGNGNGNGDVLLSYGSKNAGGLTQQGKDHAINQDRGIIVAPFYIQNEKVQYFYGSENDFFIAIYDGHGPIGEQVSEFLQKNLHKRFSDKLSDVDIDKLSPNVIKHLLNETFLEMDQELPSIPGSEYNVGEDGGSTASLILRLGSLIFFANAGDSLSFLAKYDKSSKETTIIHRNRFDKPHLPEERKRIESMKGKVFIPPHAENSRASAFYPIRKEVMSLAMSRSIGDNPHTRVGVTAEPIVDVLDINDYAYFQSGERKDNIELFVVTSSDGLYDHRKPEFVAKRFAKSFYQEDGHAIVESANIIDLATPKDPNRYRDDITVMSLKVIV